METTAGYDPAVWSQMADQLGLQGLIIPEEFGGSGYGYVELVVVLEEMGRALLCAPYFSSVVMAANLLMASGDERREEGLPARHRQRLGHRHGGAGRGRRPLGRSGRDARSRRRAAAAGRSPARSSSSSTESLADVVLAAARTRGGVSVFAVEKGAAGFSATPMPTMDQTRKQARLTFDSTPARLVGGEGDGWPAISAMLDLAVVALAAEQAGGAQKVLEMAVEYAKVRIQFGRPVGSFQAIKHKCADMVLDVESAKSAAYYAGRAAAAGDEELPVLASLAKACCSDGVFARRRGEHPDPRRYRLHLGASRSPVLQAGQEL